CLNARTAGYNYWADWGPDIASQGTGTSWNTAQPLGIGACYPIISPKPGTACNSLPSSPHTAGIMCAMGDGSVHFVAQGVSPATWWYAMTPGQGEILGSDW